MSNGRSRFLLIATGIALCGALSGCVAGQAPDRVDPAEPEPTAVVPEATPAVSAIVVAGAEVRVLDESGAVIALLPYSAATAFLAEHLGSDPVITEEAGDGNCVGDTAVARWDDGLALAFGDLILPEGQKVYVRATAADVDGIAVETPQGVVVGESVELLKAQIPLEQQRPPVEQNGIVYDFVDYDVASGAPVAESDPEYYTGRYWGAHARGENGVVTLLGAPALYVDLC